VLLPVSQELLASAFDVARPRGQFGLTVQQILRLAGQLLAPPLKLLRPLRQRRLAQGADRRGKT